MIPKNIKYEHVLKAIDEAEKLGISPARSSEKYDLEYNKKLYPPKYIISLANKYANGKELDHREFAEGDEANNFLVSLGFNVANKQNGVYEDSIESQEHDFAPKLKEYLENIYSIKVNKSTGRAHLSFRSGAIVHVRGARLSGFYYLQEEAYKDIVDNANRFFAVVFGNPETTFVFSKEDLKSFFGGSSLTSGEGKKPKWYFDIREDNDKYYLKIHSKGTNEVAIDNYLNKWDQIEDFKQLNLSERSSKRSVFVTGYDDTNLKISKKSEILGWKNRPSKMSIGDYVFVFNTTTDKIESCFEIKSAATTRDRIWREEKETTSPLSNPIYPYRWNAVLRTDDLGITTADIFALAPFNTDKNTFSMLIRNKFPRSLDDPQYAQFRNFLLDKIRTSEQKTISVTIEDLTNTTYLPIEKLKEIEALLKDKRQIIFYGPPGTGKTFIAIQFAKYLKSKYHGDYSIVQFHPSYSYEDFVEGIKPVIRNGSLEYKPQDAIFKILCKQASTNNEQKYILIIDEINRGNLSKIFGELVYGIEYRGNKDGQVTLPYTNEPLTVPENLWIIGTMNSADRSIAMVDYALRRRFYFVELMPDPQILNSFLSRCNSVIDKDMIVQLFNQINQTIANDEKLGRHYQLGHSYFMIDKIDNVTLNRIWKYAIRPILEEYYFEDYEQIEKFEKIMKEITGG
jgi:hypothetical protein